jgi:hypothetical protein
MYMSEAASFMLIYSFHFPVVPIWNIGPVSGFL